MKRAAFSVNFKPREKICKFRGMTPTNPHMKRFLLSVVLTFFTAMAFGQSKTLLNLDKNGLSIQGYDPVAFVTEGKAVKGDSKFPVRHNGATYYFASKAHRDAFKADPAKYEPAFGGYCAYGVSRGKLVEIDPEAFQIVDGKLLLQYSKGVRDDFNKDTKGNLAKANTNWPTLLEKKGK
jgi:YHS domain-containing protein